MPPRCSRAAPCGPTWCSVSSPRTRRWPASTRWRRWASCRRPPRAHRPAARPLAPGRTRRPQPRPLPPPPARAQRERVVRRGPSLVSRPQERLQPPADVIIDTRPLWRILAGHTYRPVVLLAGLLAFLALRAMEPPAGLTAAGQSALAIFALCLVYWVTNVIPLMVTSLLAMVLLPTTGVLSAKDTYALFGNEAVFFILGAFILAASLMKCGLSTRIAIAVLRRFGHTPRTLLLSLYLMNAFMAFFMSEHAVAAMTFPITVEIARVLRLRPERSNYARALFLALAGVTVLFVRDIVGWRDVEQYVNWGVLLMYGGAIALGAALNRSGAAAWLAKILLSQWGHSPAAVIALLSAISIVLTEVMSNSAVVALLLPVALGISQQFGIDPRAMAPAIALPAGLAFTLPVGTPGNAIAYSSGYLRLRDMLVPGSILVVIAWAAFNLVAVYYWPLIGITLAVPRG